MRKADLEQALVIARSKARLDMAETVIFDGFGLPDFRPVTCTVEALAALVRWQCIRFDGSVDAEALDEIATCGRKRFQVLGGASCIEAIAAA